MGTPPDVVESIDKILQKAENLDEEEILKELEAAEEAYRKRRRKSRSATTLTEEELLELYRQWKLEGKSLSQIAREIGVSRSSLYNRFKKLEEQMSGAAPPQTSAPGKLETQLMRKVSSTLATEAIKIHDQIYDVGRYVYIKYSRDAYGKGMTVYEYIENAVSLYSEWPELKQKIYETISKLLRIIELQRRIIEYLAPRASPMIRYEIATKFALELLDRQLLLKLIGVKTPSKVLREIFEEMDRRMIDELGEEEYGFRK